MKDFATYKQALALKDLGFSEPCFGKFDNYQNFDLCSEQLYTSEYISEQGGSYLLAPLKSQIFRWFRDEHRKVDYPEFDYDEQKWHCHSDYKKYKLFDTCEEAESACIDKLIEIVKTK